MGKYDSSKTRVAPLFDQLLKADPSGASWLAPIMMLGSRTEVVRRVPTQLRLTHAHPRRWGNEEMVLPAPGGLLEYLVQHFDLTLSPSLSDQTQAAKRRRELARGDRDAITEALTSLRRGVRGRRWFVLEGESRPDAFLECEGAVFCIEGKRTEATCTTRTCWMRRRSQLVRHMDAALERYRDLQVFGLLIVEGDGGADAHAPSSHWRTQSCEQHEESMIRDSLPHRSPAERDRITAGILGVTTWQAVCAATNISWASLPNAV